MPRTLRTKHKRLTPTGVTKVATHPMRYNGSTSQRRSGVETASHHFMPGDGDDARPNPNGVYTKFTPHGSEGLHRDHGIKDMVSDARNVVRGIRRFHKTMFPSSKARALAQEVLRKHAALPQIGDIPAGKGHNLVKGLYHAIAHGTGNNEQTKQLRAQRKAIKRNAKVARKLARSVARNNR